MYFVIIASIPDKNNKKINNPALYNIHQDTLLNHQIKNILKHNKQAKVLVVSSFESNKIQSSSLQHNRVIYVTHDYDERSNVGQSLQTILKYLPDDHDIHIIDVSMIIEPSITKEIKSQQSMIISNKSSKFKSKLGCTTNADGEVEFVFYDLPHKISHYIFISKNDVIKFKNIINTCVKNYMYLFEIINLLINNYITINLYQTSKHMMFFDNPNQTNSITRYLQKYGTNNRVKNV